MESTQAQPNRCENFDEFAEWLHQRIRDEGVWKSYEGELHVERTGAHVSPPLVVLTLKMYVIAPTGRIHEWSGATLGECIVQARADVERWLAEGDDDDDDEANS